VPGYLERMDVDEGHPESIEARKTLRFSMSDHWVEVGDKSHQI